MSMPTTNNLALELAKEWQGSFRFRNHRWEVLQGHAWVYARPQLISAEARAFLQKKANQPMNSSWEAKGFRERSHKPIVKLAQQYLSG